METCRFVEITDKELIEFVEDKENPNTKRKIRPRTKSIVIQKNFIQTSNSDLLGSTTLHELSPQVLKNRLSKFIFN